MPLGSRSAQDHQAVFGSNTEQSVAKLFSQPFSKPWRYVLRMVVFLGLIGFIGYILQNPIHQAFMANPALNGLMAGVLFIGVLLTFVQVIRLFREVNWVRYVQTQASATSQGSEKSRVKTPILLAPMASILEQEHGRASLSPAMLRTMLDSIASRLDETRETTRYLGGLLIFLGLLGTFWGLLETVGSIGKVIGSMRSGGESATLFDELKAGLAMPLAGMGVSFASSLFGLAGSLIVGFLDLQAGQAQRSFYAQVEDWLSLRVKEEAITPHNASFNDASLKRLEEVLTRNIDQFQAHVRTASTGGDTAQSTARAIVHLAESVGGMVQQMRHEQQLIRDWVEAQAAREQALAHDLKTLIAQVVMMKSAEHKPHLHSVQLQSMPVSQQPVQNHPQNHAPRDEALYDDTLSHIEAIVSDVQIKPQQHAHHEYNREQHSALSQTFAEQTGTQNVSAQNTVQYAHLTQKREGL